MKDYNLFTKELFAQGYSFEQYPDYARLPNHSCDRQLFDILGGFEFERHYLHSKVYATGCGLLCKGSEFSNGYLSYGGIDWKPENNNPVIGCPYWVNHCSLRHPLLDGANGGGLSKLSECNCHEVNQSYDYDQSIQKIRDEQNRLIRQQYEKFRELKENHVCHWHMNYNYWTKTWKQVYDPAECARSCQNIGGVCNLTHTPISKKRGNVFYDLKITKIRRDDTFFNGQEEISIQKGCRFLECGTSLTICENIARYCKNDILQKVQHRYSRQILLNGWTVEVLNIRAEQRESRDLLQDLRDIREGITVVHASDQIKQKKEAKRLRRDNRKMKREQKLKNKIVKNGWQSISPNSIDYFHAMKWFGEEEIQFLKQQHQKYLEDEKSVPQQMSLFDLTEE